MNDTIALTVLAFMQCQWLRNPERTKRDIEKLRAEKGDEYAEKYRRRIIEYALFAGCKSGRILQTVFGEKTCDDIVWEESSRDIGGHSAAAFPADMEHMRKCIEAEEPAIVIAFGKVACDAMRKIRAEIDAPFNVVYAPHPAARHPGAIGELMAAKRELDVLMSPISMEDLDA